MELESWLKASRDIVNVQIPNEIFEDFSKANFNGFNHKCFAYGYYYMISYLYRNALYGGGDTDQYSQANIIRCFTGNKTVVSYITKSGGLLDKIGYTETSNDYPITYYMDNGILEFGYIKDLRSRMPNIEVRHSPRFFIKKPVKGFVRFENEDCTGSFYSFQSTHQIEIEKFIKIISDDKLGHVGIYIYGYLKMMCDRYKMGYQISNQELGDIVGCSDRTIQNYTHRLEELKFIESTRRTSDYKLLQKVYTIT